MTIRLTLEEARRIAVRAQLLDADRPGDVVEVTEQLGFLKVDPTAVVAPCEHTMLWSRIGWSYEPGQLTKALDDDRLLFEYDGTIRPMSVLPLLRPLLGMHNLFGRTREWAEANAGFRDDILARLRSDGPLKAGDIDDTSQVQRDNDSGWYGSTQVPRMLEVLQRMGDVAVAGREGRTRLWDLAERVYPEPAERLTLADAEQRWDEERLRAVGIARQNSAYSGVGLAGETAKVEGSSWTYRVDPEAVSALGDDPGGRVVILNPYDTMLRDRPRLIELFEFEYVLEQFKPKAQRRYGYFAHPILVGDRFVALLDAELSKDKQTLRVNALHELLPLEAEEQEMIRAEIQDLADWIGVPVTGLA
ncbi:DNA glycosylase AlkZ-like family protein [Microbacterium gorillae]|uniref:DNA glycosylase AlkZ-like family protein n=1 Tax=Microbacterium gorillae TaxID=1231063 RepID=UPI000590DD0A|nr:crosslink repair DNA glycosylase YcaQ family protein [Microbacterium gorillae]